MHNIENSNNVKISYKNINNIFNFKSGSRLIHIII